MSESHKKENLSEETIRKLSESHKGENNSSAKLTWERVFEIRKKYKEGLFTRKELANEYGVKVPAIFRIVTYRSWKEEDFYEKEK